MRWRGWISPVSALLIAMPWLACWSCRLQLALIPLVETAQRDWHRPKAISGIWMAHTGFGLPLAIYLLRNYMVGLPRDIIENPPSVDGATDFQVFVKIMLAAVSFPALASFAIFQFLWTWNDLLVSQGVSDRFHWRDPR